MRVIQNNAERYKYLTFYVSFYNEWDLQKGLNCTFCQKNAELDLVNIALVDNLKNACYIAG
uniref:Uncharacterized protein n=1 Tax=Arion vulgaris TaxID=1028688 RepID=A0A0B6YNL2_9EUPU